LVYPGCAADQLSVHRGQWTGGGDDRAAPRHAISHQPAADQLGGGRHPGQHHRHALLNFHANHGFLGVRRNSVQIQRFHHRTRLRGLHPHPHVHQVKPAHIFSNILDKKLIAKIGYVNIFYSNELTLS